MSGFSNNYKRNILAAATSSIAYVALTLVNPTYYDDGSSIVEPLPADYDTYVRMSIAPVDWQPIFEEDNIISISNLSAIIFPTCEVNSNALIFGYALCDQIINGNVLAFGEFPPQPIGTGITPILPPSSIVLQLA